MGKLTVWDSVGCVCILFQLDDGIRLSLHFISAPDGFGIIPQVLGNAKT